MSRPPLDGGARALATGRARLRTKHDGGDLLLQVAHLLMQLLARNGLIEPVSTLTFLAALLLEAWRNLPLSEELFDPQQPRFQIRFTRAPTRGRETPMS